MRVSNVEIEFSNGYLTSANADINLDKQTNSPISGTIFFSKSDIQDIEVEARKTGGVTAFKAAKLSFWLDRFYQARVLLESLPISPDEGVGFEIMG
jgi:hypothetical protein